VGRQLYPDIDMWAVAKPLIYKWMMREKFSPKSVYERVSLGAEELAGAALELPLNANSLLSRALKDELKIGFAHHGVDEIADGLTDSPKVLIYLFDSTFSRDPLNYVMNMFIASAISNRFLLPQLSILSKADLIGEEELEEVAGWSEDPTLLEDAINRRLTGLNRLVSQDMMEVIRRLGIELAPFPVSARTNLGFNRLYAELTRLFTGGERFTP